MVLTVSFVLSPVTGLFCYRADARSVYPLPSWERVARIVRCETGEGFSPRMQTPHPARTSHSRCEASASFEKNGGRRPPMATFSHKGRRKKRARRKCEGFHARAPVS